MYVGQPTRSRFLACLPDVGILIIEAEHVMQHHQQFTIDFCFHHTIQLQDFHISQNRFHLYCSAHGTDLYCTSIY